MFLAYIHDNKIHGFHDFVNQVQSRHDFIHRVVRGLSLANHHRALTYRMLLKPSIELINDEGYSLIHESVQVRLGARHLYRHANLKNQNQCQSSGYHDKKGLFQTITYRQPVITQTMAMVAAIGPGGMHTHNHLIPPLTLT